MDGRVLEVNNAALVFASVTKDAVLGVPFWDTPWWAHDAAQRERLRHAMAASAAHGETVAFVATHVSASGEVAVVDFSVRPARGGSGVATYLVVEGRDVTARVAAERSLASRVEAQVGERAAVAGTLEATQGPYKAVVETVVDGIVVIDDRGTIGWTNAAAARLFGYSTADLVGRNVRVLMPSPYRAEHDEYLRRYLTTGERRIIGIGREVRGLRQDGSEFPLYLAVGETSVNGTRKFTGILRDLTINKALERQLRSARRWLRSVSSPPWSPTRCAIRSRQSAGLSRSFRLAFPRERPTAGSWVTFWPGWTRSITS
jgi:PAS domain S-box-containing protein